MYSKYEKYVFKSLLIFKETYHKNFEKESQINVPSASMLCPKTKQKQLPRSSGVYQGFLLRFICRSAESLSPPSIYRLHLSWREEGFVCSFSRFSTFFPTTFVQGIQMACFSSFFPLVGEIGGDMDHGGWMEVLLFVHLLLTITLLFDRFHCCWHA